MKHVVTTCVYKRRPSCHTKTKQARLLLPEGCEVCRYRHCRRQCRMNHIYRCEQIPDSIGVSACLNILNTQSRTLTQLTGNVPAKLFAAESSQNTPK